MYVACIGVLSVPNPPLKNMQVIFGALDLTAKRAQIWGLFGFLGCGPGRGEIKMNGLLDHCTQIQ